jgi:hypothetical protein
MDRVGNLSGTVSENERKESGRTLYALSLLWIAVLKGGISYVR